MTVDDTSLPAAKTANPKDSDEASIPKTPRTTTTVGTVWKDTSDSFSNAWKWKHPQWGEFYMEEGEAKWTDEFFSDYKSHGVSMTFIMDDSFEDQEDYDWETQAPPRPSARMLDQMQRRHERGETDNLLTRDIAQAFFED